MPWSRHHLTSHALTLSPTYRNAFNALNAIINKGRSPPICSVFHALHTFQLNILDPFHALHSMQSLRPSAITQLKAIHPPLLQIKAALALWEGPSSGGSFVFTSSMSVCSAENGEMVTEEDCPMVSMGKGPTTDRLLAAEGAVLEVSVGEIQTSGKGAAAAWNVCELGESSPFCDPDKAVSSTNDAAENLEVERNDAPPLRPGVTSSALWDSTTPPAVPTLTF